LKERRLTDRGRLFAGELIEEGRVLVDFVGRPRSIGTHGMLECIAGCMFKRILAYWTLRAKYKKWYKALLTWWDHDLGEGVDVG
jgi:hypothetical protein